jgi:hypothetical protein
VEMIPPPLLEAVNDKLQTLCYEPVSQAWNAEPRPVSVGGPTVWACQLAAMMGQVDLRRSRNGGVRNSFAVVAEDHAELRWVINPESGAVRQGDGAVDSVVIGTAEDLALMISGEENLGVLLRSGRVRYVTADEQRQTPRELLVAIESIRALLASARWNGGEVRRGS